MTQQQVLNKLATLPLVLAGPIVRKVMIEDQKDESGNITEKASVSVWLALKEKRKTYLKLYETENGTSSIASASIDPTQIGDNLFITLVTIPLSANKLKYGKRYYYELSFKDKDNVINDLWDIDVVSKEQHVSMRRGTLLLTGHLNGRLFFETPAKKKEKFYVAHASCRKPHGGYYKEEKDALEHLYHEIDGIESGQKSKAKFPQQLFLTGDQIYADDVDCGLFSMIQEWIPVLYSNKYNPNKHFHNSISKENFVMGARRNTVNKYAGFKQEAPYGQNHLIHEAEFYLMYLFVWSDVLWPSQSPSLVHAADLPNIDLYCDEFPFIEVNIKGDMKFLVKGEEKYHLKKICDLHEYRDDNGEYKYSFGCIYDSVEDLNNHNFYFREVSPGDTRLYKPKDQFVSKPFHLNSFKEGLSKLRKIFAHIPTYMIFDDHDVTDDWFVNKEWSQRVLGDTTNSSEQGRELGRYIVSNGMMGYAIFQGWGNKPFDSDLTGTSNTSGVIEKISDWYTNVVKISNYTGGFESLRIHLKDELIPSIVDDYDITYDNSGGLRLDSLVKWSYFFDCGLYKVIVLDTRTKRGFFPHKNIPSCLISSSELLHQLPLLDSYDDNDFTILISSAPAIGIDGVEKLQNFKYRKEMDTIAALDYEPWSSQPIAWDALFYGLSTAKKIIALSGDVHYGFAQYGRMWDSSRGKGTYSSEDRVTTGVLNTTGNPDISITNRILDIIQFVASSSKNSDNLIHQKKKGLSNVKFHISSTRLARLGNLLSSSLAIIVTDVRTTNYSIYRQQGDAQVSLIQPQLYDPSNDQVITQHSNFFKPRLINPQSSASPADVFRLNYYPARQYAIFPIIDSGAQDKKLKTIVGVNNIGLIEFDPFDSDKPVQRLLYCVDGVSDTLQRTETKYVADPSRSDLQIPYRDA